MHKIDRALVDAPACLATYDYQTRKWDDIDRDCKAAVRFALTQIQGIRCAYCESTIRHEGHIEHFRRKNAGHFPELCFTWTNLFLACGSRDHCGHFKDRRHAPPYRPDLLIKPDEDDPDDYFYFHSSGEVRIRTDLSKRAAVRATETIRVFGLNEPALAGARARAVGSYRKRDTFDELLQVLSTWDERDREEYLEQEIDATRFDEYATTIKHFLRRMA